MSVHADIEAYLDGMATEDRAMAERLTAAIEEHLPEAEGRIWHAHPVWFLDGNPVVGYSKIKDGMRLLFWSGQSFGESPLQPEGKFQAAGIRYDPVEAIDGHALSRWLHMARDIQWDYKNLVKRKGQLERLK